MLPVIPYLHPIVGFGTIALAAWAASLGLRARSDRPDAGLARLRHAALGPWLWAAFATSWLGGLATTHWAPRPEIESATSGHFTIGSVILALVTAGALLSLRIRVDERARTIHPLLGAAALLLCGFQIFLGLQLLP